METIKYKIAYWALGKLDKLVEKYNRKSAKIGKPELKFDIEIVNPDDEKKRHLLVSFSGNPAKIGGWEFIGTIQHEESGNILRSIPGRKEIPESYRNAKPVCEHCGHKRTRNDTFVLVDETGSVKQVGRNCLRDFLGHDPSVALALLDVVRDISETFSDRMELRTTPREVVEMAAAMTVSDGWSNELAGKAWTQVFPTRDTLKLIAKGKLKTYKITEESKEMANKALTWIESCEGNGFINNIRTVLSMKTISYKESKLAAWTVGAYVKEEEKERVRKFEKKEAEKQTFLGNIGDKMEAEVTVIGFRTISTTFGDSNIFDMATENNERITWMTGTNILKNFVDKKIIVKFTVKSHREFKNKRETQVTRLKVLE